MLRGALLVAVAAASFVTPPALPPSTRRAVRLAAAPALQMVEEEDPTTLPAEAMEQVPPEKLAAAWRRDELANKLTETLKGCSLYIVGLGGRKQAVGRALARRLKYRYMDVTSLMCSTYQQMSASEEPVSMQTLVAKEPLEDVAQLSGAVMREVQQFVKSVTIVWDGAIDSKDFMVMQQGIVVNVVGANTLPEEVALPSEDAEATMEAWADGHKSADVEVTVEEGEAPDDVVAKLVENMLKFIEENPRMSDEWKAKAEAAYAQSQQNQQ